MNRFLTVALAGALLAGLPPAASADPAAQIASQAAFGLRLIEQLATDTPTPPNLVVSPAGLATVLAALDVGADSGMHAAIAATLGVPADALGDVRTGAADLSKLPIDGPLAFASVLFADRHITLLPTVAPKLAAAGVPIEVADLGQPSGLSAVNTWVADHTAGLIPTILDEPPGDDTLVGVNALHFKDAWESPFDAHATAPHPFQLVIGSASSNKPVPMMHDVHSIRVREDSRYVAVSLPYKASGYNLVVVADKGPPAPVKAYAGAADWLTGAGFTYANVNLALPAFQTTMNASLLSDLDAMGLAAGHSATAFNGFSTTIFDFAKVVQKTLIKVDEKGTEAAAATAGAMQALSLAPPQKPPIDITIDKPFLFALSDPKTGFVLLAGYIGDPTAP